MKRIATAEISRYTNGGLIGLLHYSNCNHSTDYEHVRFALSLPEVALLTTHRW